tara:strand:- start:715 stop:1128 length:414 start_codon:yes stop_codon:yes gene_type:complete
MNDQLLLALENETNASIVELNSRKIKEYKKNIFDQLHLSKEQIKIFSKKLKDYRYCNDMKDIQFGFYIRWIPLKNPNNIYITNGGYICDIKVINNELHIVCKNNFNNYFQIKFDECAIFQKISLQEKVILKVLDYLE